MLPWLLLDTKNRQKWAETVLKAFILPEGQKASAEGQSSPQELDVGPRSGPYILVNFKTLSKPHRIREANFLTQYFFSTIYF